MKEDNKALHVVLHVDDLCLFSSEMVIISELFLYKDSLSQKDISLQKNDCPE
jgi:hypothetical protein